MRPIASTLCAVTLAAAWAGPAPGQSQAELISENFHNSLTHAIQERHAAYFADPLHVAERCRRHAQSLANMDRLIAEAEGKMSRRDVYDMRVARHTEGSYPCPPGGPPPPPQPPLPPPPPSEAAINAFFVRWVRTSGQIDADFAAAEADRQAGECQRRANRLRDLRRQTAELMDEAARGGAMFSERALNEYNRLIAEALSRPCPPGAPPAPPPPAQVAAPPTQTSAAPPPEGIREQDAQEVAQQQRLFQDLERERAEDHARRARDRVAVSVSGGYASLEIPVANYAFVSDGPVPAPDRPAAYSVRHPGGFTLGASLETRLGTFTLDYAQADASNRVEIAAGATGTRRGYPYTAVSPSGSTGIGGNVPIEVEIDERVESYRFGWSVHFGADPPQELLEEMRARLRAEAGLTVGYRDRDHVGITSITTPVLATQTLEQEVEEWEIGVFAGVEAIIPFSADVRLTLGARAGLDYHNFDLDALETNDQNFGPGADRAFTRQIRDSVGDISYHGDGIAELSFDLSDGFEMFVRGRASYYSDRAQVLNPFSGTAVQNGETTRLETDDAVDTSIVFGVWFSFE